MDLRTEVLHQLQGTASMTEQMEKSVKHGVQPSAYISSKPSQIQIPHKLRVLAGDHRFDLWSALSPQITFPLCADIVKLASNFRSQNIQMDGIAATRYAPPPSFEMP